MAKDAKAKQAQRLDGNSFCPQTELAALLKVQFPNIFTDGKIDGDKLKQSLGEQLDTTSERYGLSWAGKNDCFRHIQEPTTATLKPARKESVDFDSTENLFIEGDNLEVLKVLQKSYYGKIKMIYIDPPYNTGNDSFIYPDRFKEEKDSYELRANIKDAEGNLIKDGFWRKNNKDAGHFHSNWLSMMYPRLFLARNLLREDGVIFVSIDDNEVHNLRMIMDEVFGEECFIAQIVNVNNPKGRSDDEYIATAHEYVLIYQRQDAKLGGWEPGENVIRRYRLHDADGDYREIDLRKTGDNDLKEDRPNLFYYFYYNQKTNDFYPSKESVCPKGYIQIKPTREDGREGNWRWGLDSANEKIKSLVPKFMPQRKKWTVFEKDYIGKDEKIKPTSAWTQKEFNSERGTEQFVELGFDKRLFPRPKPVGGLQQIIKIGANQLNEDIILDFFAGSCTTAHAVMQLNAEDGGNRKFICVQLSEPCEKEGKGGQLPFKILHINSFH